MAWADKDLARQHWPDAKNLEDEVLQNLLDAAHPSCREFAPAHSEPVPVAYRLAHVLQAREVYNAAVRDSQDGIGVGEFVIRARPLTAAVKQLLRPRRGRPGVG